VFMPVTAEVVQAARDAVKSAEEIRQRECGAGDPRQRGPNCRQRETEQQTKRDALAVVLTNMALADRAAKLDQDAETLRAKLGKAPLVEKPNPLGETLELLLGAAAAALTAWQQAVVAAVFELCLVGVMVIYELLGQHASVRGAIQDKADPDDRQPDREPIAASGVGKRSASSPGRSRPKPLPALASVKTFIAERVLPADGEQVEMKILVQEYRSWCVGKGSGPVDLESFLEEVEKVCRKVGIEIVNDAQRVFCLNVRIDAAESANASLH
jgi:hypothetical protein